MRIVDRNTFLALPDETIFCKYEPHVFGDLCIKGASYPNDFVYQPISDSVECDDFGDFVDTMNGAVEEHETFRLDLDCPLRDALFENDQLFAIWEANDLDMLIERLQRCHRLQIAVEMKAQIIENG